MRISNDVEMLSTVMAGSWPVPARPPRWFEATNGWYWAVDALQDLGAGTPGTPLESQGIRVPAGQEPDASDLADLLRMGRLPQAWIGHPGTAGTGTAPRQALQLLPIPTSDVRRFARAEELTCWAELTPKHHESDTHAHRGHIAKRGSRLVRWAAIESVQVLPIQALLAGIRAGATWP